MADATYREKNWGSVGGVDQPRVIGIEAKARAAFVANTTFLAIASPTAAQIATQTKLLTREVNGILRLLLGDFTSDTDT